MALYLITGVPGGGKGSFSTKLILGFMSKGHRCGGIMPLKLDGGFQKALADIHGVEFDPEMWTGLTADQMREFYKYVPGSSHGQPTTCLFFDEAQFGVHSLDKSQLDKMYRELFFMISVHRHYGYDIYFISQHEDLLHPMLQKQAARIYRCNDMRTIPTGLGFNWPLNTFRVGVYIGRSSVELDKFHIPKDPRIWGAYDSFNHYETIKTAGVRDMLTVKKVKRGRPKMWKIVLVVVLVFFGIWIAVRDVRFLNRKPVAAQVAPAVAPQVARADPGPPVVSAFVESDDSFAWVSGVKVWVGTQYRGWRLDGSKEERGQVYAIWTRTADGRQYKVRI